jgi:hypothetical protein
MPEPPSAEESTDRALFKLRLWSVGPHRPRPSPRTSNPETLRFIAGNSPRTLAPSLPQAAMVGPSRMLTLPSCRIARLSRSSRLTVSRSRVVDAASRPKRCIAPLIWRRCVWRQCTVDVIDSDPDGPSEFTSSGQKSPAAASNTASNSVSRQGDASISATMIRPRWSTGAIGFLPYGVQPGGYTVKLTQWLQHRIPHNRNPGP